MPVKIVIADLENLVTKLTELEMQEVRGAVDCIYPAGYSFYLIDNYVTDGFGGYVNLSETLCYNSGGQPYY